MGKYFGAGGLLAYDDPGGIQVVIERLALAQEFRGEHDVIGGKHFVYHFFGVAHRTVDLITIMASGLMESTLAITASTVRVLKKFLSGS